MAKTCYWCESPANSMEHVPPKCIFPEGKDTSDNVDRRIELITVPSCDQHNGVKSKDDEYLLSVLAICILNNTVGAEQAKTKVLRALKNNPKLCEEVLCDYQPVVTEEVAIGKCERTVAFQLDNDRIVNAFEHIARALYFHHYGVAWQGKVTSFAEFQVAIGDDAVETNKNYEEIRSTADELLNEIEKHGSNPDVFYYQLIDKLSETGLLLIRLTFYEGTCALCKFEYS